MATTIKARFSGGVLEPLEKVELPEGQEVTILILSFPVNKDVDWLNRTAGGWAGALDAEKLKREIAESRSLTTRAEPRI